MAVTRAQNAVVERAKCLRKYGVAAEVGVHPVAGRMPGQINALLAKAGVPTDWVMEMDEVNDSSGNGEHNFHWVAVWLGHFFNGLLFFHCTERCSVLASLPHWGSLAKALVVYKFMQVRGFGYFEPRDLPCSF